MNPAAVPSKEWVCGRSITGISGSDPALGEGAYLL